MKSTSATPLFTAIDQAPGYCFITDNRAKILYSNQAILERTGFSSPEATHKKPGQLWGGNMPANFYEEMWESLKQKRQAFSGLAENKKKNGQLYKEQMHIIPLFDAREQTPKYFLAFQPLLAQREDTATFSKHFQEISLISQHNSSLFFENILQWIQAKKLSEKVDGKKTTSNIIFEQFIAPTEQKYAARFRDTELIHNAQENSEKFAEIYLSYREIITQYFLKRLGYQRNLAEDLAQETFIRAFSHLSSFSSSNASYQTYLLRIAHNILVNYYRSSVFSPLDETALKNIVTNPQKSDVMDLCKLQKSLATLKTDEREALNLMYSEGYSIREIAELYKKTENAIKLMVSWARKKLQKLMS